MGSVARGVLHVVVHAGSHADSSTEPLESAAVAAVQSASGALCSAGQASLNSRSLPDLWQLGFCHMQGRASSSLGLDIG